MNVTTIDLKKTILENNDQDASLLRQELKREKTYYLNLMSSPGAGKTTTLVNTIRRLRSMEDPLRMGVMEADIDSDVDARTIIEQTGIPAVQLHTGGMCHLDADMSRQGLRALGTEDLDLVFLENVGNLVCPAEFDTGAVMRVAILSVPEGDDKPLKYPLMFTAVDAVLVSKLDALAAFDFDRTRFCENLAGCNPDAPVFFLSGKTGEGMEEWCAWLDTRVRDWLQK